MRLLPILLLLASSTAHAGELPADPMLQLLIRGQTAPIDVGRSAFGIFEGRLSDHAVMYGARIRNEGVGDYSYACVTDGDWAIWMLSDWSDLENQPMLSAIVETQAPEPALGCERVSELHRKSPQGGEDGDPPKLADFASATDIDNMEDGLLAFIGQNTMGDGGDSWLVVSTVTYHFADDGTLDGVAYEVATID